jgi:hypothetical protein
LCFCGEPLFANPPVASYVFPAGGQRGTTVKVKVGGLFLHQSCGFELLGSGVEATRQIRRTRTLFFEGPRLPLPDSQQPEDYPKDTAAEVRIAADAAPGVRRGRLWTSEGAASGLRFVVGELPEVVEEEVEGDPVPVAVTLPVTVNGRIFPREDVDLWSFAAKKGQTVSCEVNAARLGSPLDARLEVLGPDGRVLAENDDAFGPDPFVRFTAPADGTYQARVRDANFKGGPAHVYRLTLTTGSRVDRVYPLGGRRGTTTSFTLAGQGVPAGPVAAALPADGPAAYAHRFAAGGRLLNPVFLDLDDLPEHSEAEPNDDPAAAKLVPLPAVVNGRVDRPGDADCWAFAAKKGDALLLELRAARLGSPLEGVLTVLDAGGKELAKAEAAGPRPDPVLAFTAPADGRYVVRVADRFRGRGGAAFAYRLRLAPPPAPSFRLELAADTLTVPRGGAAKLKVTADRRGGFADAIALTLDGLPAGVKAANAVIPAGQPAAEVMLTADKSAAIGPARLTVRGAAKVGARPVTETATLSAAPGEATIDNVLLGVALPPPFKIVGAYDLRLTPRGTVHRRRYKVERHGYDGPITVSVADRQVRHLQGAYGPPVVVPAGATEFEFAVRLPPWMETGRTCRVCVMGEAVLKEGAADHVVSYTSGEQNDQIIAVVETGRLGVEAEKSSVAAPRGRSVAVPVRVGRGKGLSGPVRLELVLPEHVRGVTAEPVTIAADQLRGTLALRFAADAGPFNVPAVVRATLADAVGPVVAETKVELVPEGNN